MKTSSKAKLSKAFRFFIYTSLLSFAIILIMGVTIGSPTELYLNSHLHKCTNRFVSLNHELDKLHNKLQKRIITSDKFYRQVLEVDSLPSAIRGAGTGGSEREPDLSTYPFSDLINSTAEKLEILKKQAQIQETSYKEIYKEAVLHNKKFAFIPGIPPVKPSPKINISSWFGTRSDPFTFLRKRHEGLDIVDAFNTKIYATANGTVTLAEDSRNGYGREVVLAHDFGYSTRYGHLNKILVKKGQKVVRGQVIGLMGSTGRSTGTHLHYEVRLNNRPINPYNFFSDDLSPEEYDLIIEQSLKEQNKTNGKAQL